MTTIPLVIQPLDDVSVNENAASNTVNLFEHFDDPFTTGKVARFELENSSLGGGVTNVLLFDQEGAGAPQTVANFSNYVEDNDYTNSIIHRSIPDFVVQGGGFTVSDELVTEAVPTDESVVNEFSEDRSNTRGTIAMAKLGNDPDSATSQWFFNLGDNSGNLDNQNGGFTVFGEVLREEDLVPIDTIAELSTGDASSDPSGNPTFANFVNPAFTNLPITGVIDGVDDLVRYNSITILERDELDFEITANSNPDLVDALIDRGQLFVDYTADASGTAEITIQATDLLGDSVEETYSVTVADDGVDPDVNTKGTTIYRFLNEDTGVHLYTSSKVERDNVLETLPNYKFESFAYLNVDVDALTGDAQAQQVYRFYNEDSGTHLYTVSEVERESVENTLPNYSLETESFFAYAEEQPGTIPIYRFYNRQTGAHFYTPSEAEKESVETNLPNYDSEGIAYYAFPTDI